MGREFNFRNENALKLESGDDGCSILNYAVYFIGWISCVCDVSVKLLKTIKGKKQLRHPGDISAPV